MGISPMESAIWNHYPSKILHAGSQPCPRLPVSVGMVPVNTRAAPLQSDELFAGTESSLHPGRSAGCMPRPLGGVASALDSWGQWRWWQDGVYGHPEASASPLMPNLRWTPGDIDTVGNLLDDPAPRPYQHPPRFSYPHNGLCP